MHSDKELKSMSCKAFENASELLEEAQILHERQRYARAFVLAHLASEELAKIPTIYSTRVRLYEGEEVDWKRFKANLIRHRNKLQAIALFDYMDDELDLVHDQDVERYYKQLETVKKLDTVKNLGLYSGFHENRVYKPSEQFLKENSENMLDLTKGRLICMRSHWDVMIRGDVEASGFGLYRIIQDRMSRANGLES